LALAAAVFLCFLCFALPQSYRLRSALVAIRGKSNNETEHEKRTTFQANYEAIDNALVSNKETSNVWQEFRKTLIFRGSPQRAIILASTRPGNFFSPRSLLVQYDFVRSLPNYFVGLGLLGTFIGLIAALTFSTQSLTTAVDQEKIKEALNQLLTTAAAKFYISAAGLVASLVLSLLIRLTLKHLHSRVHQINEALQERLLFVSEQNITEILDGLLQSRREVSRRIFTSSEITAGDFADVLNGTGGGQKAEEVLTEIDRSGYLGLEEFVRDRLLFEGLDANMTKRSGDGGADIVVKDELGKIIYLIQCKHTSEIELPIDAGLLVDAQRVRENWRAPTAIVVGISNAKKFAPRIVDGFKKIGGRLIAREQLAEFRLAIAAVSTSDR
jgi:hypothetical protein